MRERDTFWIELAGKPRPAILLEVQIDLVRIAYGTSKDRNWPKIVVHPNTRQGRAFGLRTTTHFYGANTAWVRPSELLRPGKACSWELWFGVAKLVEGYDASL